MKLFLPNTDTAVNKPLAQCYENFDVCNLQIYNVSLSLASLFSLVLCLYPGQEPTLV
jgi:hypothetical protein